VINSIVAGEAAGLDRARHFAEEGIIMTTQTTNLIQWSAGALVVGALMFSPVTVLSARADDDWEDRWEEYHEELEEQREEAEDRWEERRERIEVVRERRFLRPYSGWHERHGTPYAYRAHPYPELPYYREYEHGGPRYYTHDWPSPRVYHYNAYPPVYRYYGTPRIGYFDFGHGGAVRVGPIQVFWD
jgi:hypothetical protein